MKKYINKYRIYDFGYRNLLAIKTRNCLVLCCLLLGMAQLQAQPVCYDYDGSGNRVVRKDCTPPISCNCPAGNPTRYYVGEDDETTLLSNTEMYGANPVSISGGCITVSGTLIIDLPYSFYGTTMMMQPGAEIVVNNPSASLSFYGATLKACNKLWRGIRVEQSCTINSYGGTRIEDAFYAIRLGHQTTGTIDNTTLTRNHIGIFVDGSSSSTRISSNVLIKGNTFTSSGIYPKWDNSVVSANAGIEGVNAIFNVGLFNDVSALNTFSSMDCGILVTNCKVDFYNVSIHSLAGGQLTTNPDLARNDASSLGIGAWGSTIAVYHSNVTYPNRGIHLQNSTGFTLSNSSIQGFLVGVMLNNQQLGYVSIYENKGNNRIQARELTLGLKNVNNTQVHILENHIYGNLKFTTNQGHVLDINNYAADNLNNKKIEKNEIVYNTDYHGVSLLNTGRYSIFDNNIKVVSNQKLHSAHGVFLSNSQNNKIINNIVGGTYTSTLPNNYETYAIFGNSSPNNSYCCNVTNNTKNGFCFLGVNPNSKMKYNEMQKHASHGLFISSGASIGLQIDHWNKWTSTYGSNPAKSANTGTVLTDSKFEVSATLGSVFYPNTIDPLTGWFTGKPSVADITCTQTGSCSPQTSQSDGIPLFTAPALSYITRKYEGVPYGDYSTWAGSRWVLREIANNPSWLSNTNINTFNANNQNSNIKKINQLDDIFSELTMPNVVQKDGLDAIFDEMKVNDKRLQEIDGLLGNNPTEEDSIKIMEERGSLLNDQADFMNRIDNIQNDIRKVKYTKIESAKSINAVLVAQNEFERNEKTINSIYLNTIARGDSLSNGDKVVVRTIAGLCPMIGGTAVFKARFLYGYFAVVGFDDEKLCALPTGGIPIGGKIASNTNNSNPEFSIYPNPAYDELYIQTTANEAVTLILMDITGKKVAEQGFTSSTQLSISNLPNGAYFCEIWKGEQKIGVQKLSVIH